MASITNAPTGVPFLHREYQNDLITNADKSLAARISLVTLPFIGLYAPLTVAVSMGAFRVFSNLSELCTSKDPKPLHTACSIVALTATIFTPVLGFALTTSHDLLIELQAITKHLQNGDLEKVFESCVVILSNSTYLALLATGSVELAILSLATQCLAESFYGIKELNEGNYLEATGHLLMKAVRCQQLISQIKQLKAPKTEETSNCTTSCLKNFEWIVPYESLPAVFQIDLIQGFVSKDLVSYLINCQKIDGIKAKEALKNFSSASIYIDCPRGGKHVQKIAIKVSSPSENPTFSWR